MGMINVIFKVSYQNEMLATKLPVKTTQHFGRLKKKKKKNQTKKDLSSLFCNTKYRNISCPFSVVNVSVCDILGTLVHCLYWQMIKWKDGCWHLALDVPQVLTHIKRMEVNGDSEEMPMSC